jgi:hypothetical protein
MYSKRLAATVAAGVLVMSGLATSTANAATAPTVTAAPECGKVTLTVPAEVQVTPPATSVKDAARIAALHLVYQVDRQRPQSVLVTPDRDTVKVVRFQEDSGVHWVRYRLSDSRQWSDRVRVESDCRPNFKRADAPSVVQPECDAAKGKLVIPSDRGVTYKVRTATRDYRTVRAGEYKVRPGVYRVKAEARPGVKLVGVDRWRLEVEAAEACPTPTPTPTATDEPTPDPTPTVEPTVEPEPTQEPEPEPQPTVTETNTHVIVINDTRVPVRVDTGLGGLAK